VSYAKIFVNYLARALRAITLVLVKAGIAGIGYIVGTFVWSLVGDGFRVLGRGQTVLEVEFARVLVSHVVLTYGMFTPIALITIVAAFLGWRSVFYYIGSWGSVAFVFASNTERLPTLGEPSLFTDFEFTMACSASVGGLAYWAVAGRLARVREKKAENPISIKREMEREQWSYRRP
jgi:hypothetical protein